MFFYSRILWYKPITKPGKLPAVSVIVCGHNELENLKKLIPAVLAQQYEQYELIFVDDRSTDGSATFLRKEFEGNPKLKIISIEENNEGKNYKKYALTKGIENAQHEVLLLTDADCFPNSKRWIQEMSLALIMEPEKEIVLGYSPYQFKKSFLNLLIQYETLYTAIQYFSFALAGIPYMGVGRNLMYRKSVFVNNRGFESHIDVTGGDDDLFIREVAHRKNTTICFKKEAHVYSWPKDDYASWFRQKRRHLSVGTKYTGRIKFLLGVQMLAQTVFYMGLFGLFLVNHEAFFIILMIHGLVFVIIFTLLARKLEGRYRVWHGLLLPLELVYILNYLFIASSLLLKSKIKWN